MCIKKRCFIFPFISQYGRPCWRCSHASATAFSPPGSPAHGWILCHALFSCFTTPRPMSCSSSAVVAGVILLTLSCRIAQRFSFGLRSRLISGHAALLYIDAGKVLPTPKLRLLGCVRRIPVLHEVDLAGVGYQRVLQNPAALLIACRHYLAGIFVQ